MTKRYENWKKNYDIAKEYYKKFGTINVPRNLEYGGIKLGQWVQVQRLAKNGTGKWVISNKQIKMLEKLEINWGSKAKSENKVNAREMNAKYMELAHDYFDEFGDLLIPFDYTIDGYELGKWIKSLRSSYASIDIEILLNNPKKASSLVKRLSEKSIRLLNDMDMLWKEENKIDWDYKYSLAKEYFETYGNLLIPATYVANDKEKTHLGNWIRYNRQLYIRDNENMSQEHIELLNNIGMVWSIRDNLWEEKYELAKQYYVEYGHLRIPRDYMVDGYNIGNWVVWQRQAKKGNVRNSLSIERIELLDEIGMMWEVYPNKTKTA